MNSKKLSSITIGILIIICLPVLASEELNTIVSNQYQHLLDQNWRDPAKYPDEVKKEIEQRISKEIWHSLKNHQIEEQELSDYHAAIKMAASSVGLNPDQIAQSLMEHVALSVQDQKSEEIRSFLQKSTNMGRDFFFLLDRHTQDSVDLSLAVALHGFRLWYSMNFKFMSNIERQTVDETYKSLLSQLNKYLKNKDQYGQNKDTLRVSPYKKFFGILKKFSDSYTGADKVSVQLISDKAWIEKVKVKIQLLPYLAKGLREILFPLRSDGSNRNFSKILYGTLSTQFPNSDIPVELIGEENLPTISPHENKVYLFVASHLDGLADQLGIGALGREDLVLFGAPNNFLKGPHWFKKILINRLNANPGFVVVGEGANPKPIEKAILLIKQTGARAFLIFPQGRLHEGLGGSMGVRDGFNSPEGLIQSIERAGYEVVLVPISMRNNARLFRGKALTALGSDSSLAYGEDGLVVRVSPLIKPQLRKTLDQLAGPEALGFLLRYGLLEDMVTNQSLLWGKVRADKLVPHISSYLGPNANTCAQTLLRMGSE